MTARAPLVLVAALALLLVACGGDGDTGPPLTAAEFRAQGNAICAAGDAEFAEAGEDLFTGDTPTVGEVADFYLDDALPIARRKLDQLAELNPPAGEERALDDLVDLGREAIDSVEDGLREDPAAYLNQGGPDPFAEFDGKARALGLDGCATPQPELPGDEDGTTEDPASEEDGSE